MSGLGVLMPFGDFSESVQDIDGFSQLHGQDRAVGVRLVAKGDLENPAADALERLGIRGHVAELHKLDIIAEVLSHGLRKLPYVFSGISHPEKGP
jgi:hypothetical protein